MKRVSACKRVKRAEECAEYKGSLPVDELLNYINDPKYPASNSCYPSNASHVQMSESKNKKIRKKYSKESVQNSSLSCNSNNNHSLSCVKDSMKGEIVQGFSENSKCDQTVQNLEDDVFSVNDVDTNVVNNFSPDIFANGSYENSEIVHCELSDFKSKIFVPKGSYFLSETEKGNQRNSKLLNGNLNGFSSSGNESGDVVWTDQNADECLLPNVPQESFESCQSSLQSSLSSISSSLSSNKVDNHDDVRLAHAGYDISYASNFMHKSVSADDSKGAKLDVLSSFDEDYELCLPSNHQYEMIEEKNDVSAILLGYPPNITSQNESNSFTVSTCNFTEFEKAEASPASAKSSNFMFGDLSVSRVVLESSGNENQLMESSNVSSAGTSAFHGCNKANPCEVVTYITSSVVSSRCDNATSHLRDIKRFEKHHFNLSQKPVRAPVEFVNCPVEDLSSQNSLGISFGFGLEDLLEKCTSSGTKNPDQSCSGSSLFKKPENVINVCPDVNLSLKTSFVTTACLSSAVSFNWSSLSSTFVDVNANINISTSTIFASVPGYSVSPAIRESSSPSFCRYENSSYGNTDFSVQNSSSKLIWKNKSSPPISQQSLFNSAITCTSSNAILPSSCEQKLHDSLNMPVRNGFVKGNFVDGYHTSKKGDISRIACSGKLSTGCRMDELDNCFLPPLLGVMTHKSTFNLRAAQKFLYESYKETLLQSQDKSFYKNTKNKSSQLCESRSSQKNSTTTT